MRIDTEAQVRAAERTLCLAWVIVAGAVLFSVLTVTPLVERVTPDRWDWTAPILPLVVDAAVVIVVRVDAIVARLDGRPGGWPAALRWLTGGMTLALNAGDSALKGDAVGVGVHLVAPTLLIVTAEASLKWRRAITAAVTRIERERAEQRERLSREQREREERSRAEREEIRRAQERQREQERADREREREHAAKVAREERDHQARLAQEERDHAAQLAAAERERNREHERQEAQRNRRAAERPTAVAAAVSTHRQSVSTPVSTPAHVSAHKAAKGTKNDKMSESDARKAVATAVREGRSQRQTAKLTGWSTGWVANRYAELEELEQVPGQTGIEIDGVAA